jgi:hypothetical protein
MDDLSLAKERLRLGGKRLVVVHGGRIVAESDEPGVSTTLACLGEARRRGPGCVVADRIVGRAAAWLALWAGARACYGEVLSRTAERLLLEGGLKVEASLRVESILDRARKGPCPLEAAVAEARGPEEAMEIIRSLTAKPDA